MERDSAATKRRLLDAAEEEFARYGLAGARVARIADAGAANKQAIYAYFGDKTGLFDAVLAKRHTDVLATVSFDADDVVGFVGRLFDYITENPTVMRLAAWKRLERPVRNGTEDDDYLGWTTPLLQAQRDGRVDATFDPASLSILLYGLASAWDSVRPLSIHTDTTTASETATLSRNIFRQNLLEATRRLTTPIAQPDTDTAL
ncbi:TetR family transcriptional regulator [Rhodococcus sp. IEGM 1354]|uniref:TetR/AcrR family transcriptional regulator n=1 Tax=Rhodococcus sp. IEGM 1354 TaxID=3047088 RepID=UPI0024B7CB96|nr:TetR family transcriptional regulator [Rhodococcus sp. IEGM 1354]MDI9929698.1 TetR family transcriptional regulator [Rhodococcus sp. IEGM 1354]